MADPTNHTSLIADMAAQIRGACMKITDNADAMYDAMDMAQNEARELQSLRLQICVDIAKLAHDNKWSSDDLDEAVKLAMATPGNKRPGGERTDRNIQNFMSQVKAVARPRVRGRFPVILAAIEDAWEAEQESVKEARAANPPQDVNTPLRKFVSRKYEMVLRACREMNDVKSKLDITCAADVVTWAIENDPDFDADKIERRIKTMLKQLREMHDDFGFDPLDTVCDVLSKITSEELLTSRNAKIAAEKLGLENVSVSIGPTKPATTVAETKAETEAQASAEPIEGAFDYDDMIDAALDGQAHTGAPQLAMAA